MEQEFGNTVMELTVYFSIEQVLLIIRGVQENTFLQLSTFDELESELNRLGIKLPEDAFD